MVGLMRSYVPQAWNKKKTRGKGVVFWKGKLFLFLQNNGDFVIAV